MYRFYKKKTEVISHLCFCFYEKAKELRLSGSLCGVLIKPSPVGICECAKHACRRRRDGFGNRAAVGEICECTQCSCRPRREGFGFRLPCVRDLQVCGACLQASPRRVRKPRSGWSVKKQSLTACGGAPFTQGSRKPAFSINPRRRLTAEVYFCKRNFNNCFVKFYN